MSNPLVYAGDVEYAIRTVAPEDLQLSNGAALLANPSSFTVINQDRTPISRALVPLVTVVSLNPNGETTHSTAIFGMNDATVEELRTVPGAWLENLKIHAQGKVIGNLLGNENVGYGIYTATSQDNVCPIGGIALVRNSKESGSLEQVPFVSNALIEYLRNRYDSTNRLRGGIDELACPRDVIVDPAIRTSAMFLIAAAIKATAKRDGEPVTVKRHFLAKI